MKRLAAILIVSLSLSGCAAIDAAVDVAGKTSQIVTGAKVSPTAVVVAVNSFNAVEATATNYLRLPRCKAGGPVVCRSPSATKAIIPAIRSGRSARDALMNFAIDHPGELGPSGLYDALVSATGTIRAVYNQYGIGS